MGQLGLVLDLLDTDPSSPGFYKILGGPPSFDSITRDTFPEGTQFALPFVLSVLRGIAAACCHIHNPVPGVLEPVPEPARDSSSDSDKITRRGMRILLHGDLYAHNILVRSSDGHPLLTDFGAASFVVHCEAETGVAYTIEPPAVAAAAPDSTKKLERIEVRAFGCLVEDLLSHITGSDMQAPAIAQLQRLQQDCCAEVTQSRPLFVEIVARVNLIQ
jgi:serine/threonine protein kinase